MWVLPLHGDWRLPRQRPASVYVHIYDRPRGRGGSRACLRPAPPGIARLRRSRKACRCSEVILTCSGMVRRSAAGQLARNATIGSIRDALQAGIYPATAATAISSAPIPINVTGSPGVTPNNRLPSALDRARDAAIPSASPKAANPSVCRRIRLCRSSRRGPQRHPNSNFLHSLTYRIRNHGVDPQRSEYQGEDRESGQQQHQKPPRRNRFVHQILETSQTRGPADSDRSAGEPFESLPPDCPAEAPFAPPVAWPHSPRFAASADTFPTRPPVSRAA